ncbi:hypothetical protein PF005_g8500 [Phytophthora fragariae]|uniref:Transposase IS30-like HTH domain-containing protein n=1 Tax=Phytophthora fragariae TaxID=53985 RepID=A0A6A3LAZ5_9STRA|nr:hypothetical protein PF003_g32103 [Phytophthora fragariae]KAE8940352.1 hypothetical protein PF009_g9831 [Phytophthora fragariae]KAE9016219.1 hypothetical protein PF011_g7263 [Phytophthora fragariae]KAE9117168.1 hypothetical protein PF007_g9390 [Phytophthora fragariae]KAE9118420.1 hypothetical protein PF010_g8228 [Phytophthora fragariae]
MPRARKPPTAKNSPKTKKPRLMEHERGKIEGLHQVVVSGRDIARVTKRSRDTVRRVVSPAPPTTPKPSGPAPTITDRETRRISCQGRPDGRQAQG